MVHRHLAEAVPLMDFQDAFLTLYWPAWSRMLGLYVAATVILCLYHLLVRSHRFSRPRKRETFMGQEFD
jgi:hypothetical protein